jgi:hypothetical protein
MTETSAVPPATAAVREPYGHHLARLVADYPDFVIDGQKDCSGYLARACANGAAIGPPVRHRTLDGLAAIMDAERRRMAGA